jgi:D-alanyl-lipoteichoic acid acyltransferase DltB (MBOAT superfamily)
MGMSFSNYYLGLRIDGSVSEVKKNKWLTLGLIINIGVLCVFKYYNFFIDSFIDLLSLFGYDAPRSSTRIVLPVGISFYTFLSLSYIIDIYKGKINAHKNLTEVLLCLGFFPIILAGPIQRPVNLLPQITGARRFEYEKAADGLRQILWGLFKKIVLADTCAVNADYIFNNHSSMEGGALILGAVYFAFQIYGDFSGYSDIAIGTGKLFGFDLMKNFAFPYFSRDITEFWKRWHISLTTWFRDYIFLPLSFSCSKKITQEKTMAIKSDLFIYIIASIITWFLTGLWHGANYTFILWGMIHSLFLIFYQWQKPHRKKMLKRLKISNDNLLIVIIETGITFSIVAFAWIFFKATSIQEATSYVHDIFANGVFSISVLDLRGRGITSSLIDASIAITAVIIIEWLQRNRQHGLEIQHYPGWLRRLLYWTITYFCLIYLGDERTFIYFQF